MNESNKTCNAGAASCVFCWRNPRHWYFLIATLPFFAAGVRFIADVLSNATQ